MSARTRTTRTPLGEVLWVCVGAFLALRVLTFVAAAAAHTIDPLASQGVPGWPAPPVHPGLPGLFSVFERFDALWFLRIATEGYRPGDGSAVFLPLFPLLTRGVSFLLGGHPLAAATLVSNVAFVGALVAIFRLGEEEVGPRDARYAVLLFAVFPSAYFFVMPYSESLFLLLAAGSILAARRGRWAGAAVAGAMAAATRSIGIVLAPVLLVEALERRSEGERTTVSVVAAAGPVVGVLAYAAWWQARAGDALIPLTQQERWQREIAWPWRTLWDAGRLAVEQWGRPGGGYWLLDLAIVVPVVALSVVGALRLRPTYAVLVWLSLLAPLSLAFPGRPLMSMPRFVATLFPLAWVVTELTRARPRLRIALLVGSATALLVLCVLTLSWFYVF